MTLSRLKYHFPVCVGNVQADKTLKCFNQFQDVFHFYVREDVKSKTQIGKVSAIDIDSDANGKVVHTLIGKLYMCICSLQCYVL